MHAEREGSHRSGRPRSAHVDYAVIDAAVDLLAEGGVAGLSLQKVAERAGVSLASVYRRYRDVDDLLVTLARIPAGTVPLPDTGNAAQDLAAAIAAASAIMQDERVSSFILEMYGAQGGRPLLKQALLQDIQEGRPRWVAMFRRAIDRGDIRPDIDIDAAIDAVLAVMIYRRMVYPGDLGPAGQAGLVDLILHGLLPQEPCDTDERRG